MEDTDAQAKALDGGTWLVRYGFHLLFLGTIVTVVCVTYVAHYLADVNKKDRGAKFRQKSSAGEHHVEKEHLQHDTSTYDNSIVTCKSGVSEDLVTLKEVEKVEIPTNIEANNKEDDDVANEYRKIVDNVEYVDICPQIGDGSKGKTRINIANRDKSVGLNLIEEKIQQHNRFKETSPNSIESVPSEHKESICNRRSLVVNKNEIDITSMKCAPTEHNPHVYNGLENTNARSVNDDKRGNHLANEFILTSAADEPPQQNKQLSTKNISDVDNSSLGLQDNDLSSASGQCMPIVIISEYSISTEGNNREENVTSQQSNLYGCKHFKTIDLGLKHVSSNTEADDLCTVDNLEAPITSMGNSTTSSNMTTPEDIACFYKDDFEEKIETSKEHDASCKNHCLGELIETSFVTVIPTSTHDDWKTCGTTYESDNYPENKIKTFNIDLESYDDDVIITHSDEVVLGNEDDEAERTDNMKNENDNEDEASDNEEGEYYIDGEDVLEEEENSDESGGLETIEEVSEEELDSDETFCEYDDFGNQLDIKSTSDVTDRTHEPSDHVPDDVSIKDKFKETLNEHPHMQSHTDVAREHYNKDEHELEECYFSSTCEEPEFGIRNCLNNREVSDLTDRETKSFVGIPNIQNSKKADMENEFVDNNKQDEFKLPNQFSYMDQRNENIDKNRLSEFDLSKTSKDLDEVNDSHNTNKEVTLVEIIDDQKQSYEVSIQPIGFNINENPPNINSNLHYTDNESISYGNKVTEDGIQSTLESKSEYIPFKLDTPFVAIKELDKIRPLPFLTQGENVTIGTTELSNSSSVDIIDSACVAIQHEPFHGQIEHNELEIPVDAQNQQNEPEVSIETTAVESQLDFEAPLQSTYGPSIRVEDNKYIDDVCKHDLTSPSQCSPDQLSADQISQQTGKQSITIELHLLRRKPNSITEVDVSSATKEELVCPAKLQETAHPPEEHLENLPESVTKVEDDKITPPIVSSVENVDILLEKASIVSNDDDHATRRADNDRRPSNDEIPGSLESVTTDSTENNRKLSVHEQRVLDSLKNLQLPEWYKKSDVHKRKMKNMAEGKVLRSDNGTDYGQRRFYGRQNSSSFGSDDSDFSQKSKAISIRTSYERKARCYYSAQTLPTRSSIDERMNAKVASASYLKTQSNYDIRSDLEREKKCVLHAGHSDDMYGKEFQDEPKQPDRPQSESDLVNMEPIPLNNFKIQRQRSNKGTATFYITSVHVQNTNSKQKETTCANRNQGSDSNINASGNIKRENNNEIDQLKETNNDVHNNRNYSYPEEVTYKHKPYTYKLVYGTPQSEKVRTLVERQKNSPDGTEFYKESDHIEYYASIVQCGDDKVSDRSSLNQTNLSPNNTNDSAINLDNNMSSGPDSESFLSYGESCNSGSVYVPSVTHSAPPFVENKNKTKPRNFQTNTLKNSEHRKISSSYDEMLKPKSGNRINSGKSRTTSADSSLGSKTSPRFPVINRSRDSLLTDSKKNGISISITDTRLDDSSSHGIDEEEFLKHLHESDQKSNLDSKDKAIVMENIIDGLLGLTTPSVNSSSNLSHNENAMSSSSNLLSSESDSSASFARQKQNDTAKKNSSTQDDKNHVVLCRNCRTSANLAEAKKTFKNCHHCYTYYCSRDCRIKHWEEHKQRCLFARVSSSCKRAIAVCRDDGSTHYTLSKIARTCYLSHGRGSILIVFPNEIAARLFVHYGLRAVPSPPSYITARELEKTTEPNEHTNSLLSVCQAYDPNQSFIITVIVNIGTEIPKRPVPRRQGTAIKKCANFSLCETHVAQANTRANETTGETLILTMPPGLPPDGTRDRKLRQVCFVNIQRHLRQREVKLRHQFPSIYSALCRWVEYHESFPPTTIYPKEGNTDRPFMCLIMPESDPDALGWVTNPGLLEDIEMDGEFE